MGATRTSCDLSTSITLSTTFCERSWLDRGYRCLDTGPSQPLATEACAHAAHERSRETLLDAHPQKIKSIHIEVG
jgi:hypothetical protein